MTIATYCKALDDQNIVINHDYQRSNKIWPTTAQSFLIESILLGFPVPKLALYQITDRDTRKTVQELVDGQQRTEAIRQFFDGNLRLSRSLEFEDAAGKYYTQLPEELQDKFLAYSVAFDLFVDATPKDIREMFRRVNAYETPLNGEEQRYARYQGEFKWFIYGLSRDHDDMFKLLGTFGERQLARMADMKLLTEVVHALVNGVKTTNKRDLDSIYLTFDDEFDEAGLYRSWLDEAFLYLLDLEEIHGSPITKPFSLYSLLLAIIHASHGTDSLADVGRGGVGLRDRSDAVRRLGELSEVLELERELVPEEYKPFYDASAKGTNVSEARKLRIGSYLIAVSEISAETRRRKSPTAVSRRRA